MSAIGEFLREIMPSWLSPQPRDRRAELPETSDIADLQETSDIADADARALARERADLREARNIADEEARALAREADEVWRHCVDDGLHGEAFPEEAFPKPAPENTRRSASASGAREKPAGSNGPH